jgi:hypothetical protein
MVMDDMVVGSGEDVGVGSGEDVGVGSGEEGGVGGVAAMGVVWTLEVFSKSFLGLMDRIVRIDMFQGALGVFWWLW